MIANFRIYFFTSPTLNTALIKHLQPHDHRIAVKIGFTQNVWEDRLRSTNLAEYAGYSDWQCLGYQAYFAPKFPELAGLVAEGLAITDLLHSRAVQIALRHKNGASATEVFGVRTLDSLTMTCIRLNVILQQLGIANKVQKI
jgi:hypothetical protein